MIIHSARFVKSSPTLKDCPSPDRPEFAFTGRSNVGKSSLINMLTGFSSLAKTSGEPGKTRTINHFIINDSWYLADLPGYGFAKVPKAMRQKWTKASENYILKRNNLVCLFVLIDSRHKPQASDMKFMEFLGINGIPFARVFTKTDKLSAIALRESVQRYDDIMNEKWEPLPVSFNSSAEKKTGRDEILDFIATTISQLPADFARNF